MAVTISISSITQNSQNIAGNSSNVTVTLVAKWTGGSYNHYGEANGWLKIDGTNYTFSGVKINPNKTTTGQQTLLSKTVNVSHNADGTKVLQCSASFVTGLSSSGTQTASASKTLTTIPRASTPTVSSSRVYMGDPVTIYTNPASSNFKHDLTYNFIIDDRTGSTGTIATGVGASYTWTTPDLASKIPNSTTGTLSIRCVTKSGSTTVGTKTITMTLVVPVSAVPTISSVTVAEATNGIAAQFGAFIQGRSKIKVDITATGAKGSTIKFYKTTFNGKTYNTRNWTSPVVTSSGSMTVVTTVTDSRNRTAKKTTTINVLAYSPPGINSLQVYRVNAAGGADQNGVNIAVRYKYGVVSLNGKNTANMVVEYKRSTADDTEWAHLLTSTALSADTTALPTSPTFSTDYQYDVRMTVTDWFGEADTYTTPLRSGAVILDIRADGLGLGLFKTAEREGVDFGASPKGAVLGLWEATAEIPENGKFSDYLQPGVYNVPRNDTMPTISDRPCDRAGTLRVSSGIGTKKVAGAYAYIVQEFHSYHNQEPIYRRHLISNASGVFEPGPWRAITLRGQKVLWSGGKYMTADHQADLSEPISQQDTGIVLVFSTYQNGAPIDANFNYFFVPKIVAELEQLNGYGVAFQMNTVNFNTVGSKYLYIHDTHIKGNENNNLSGTATSGIVFNNAMYVLRYVLGV